MKQLAAVVAMALSVMVLTSLAAGLLPGEPTRDAPASDRPSDGRHGDASSSPATSPSSPEPPPPASTTPTPTSPPEPGPVPTTRWERLLSAGDDDDLLYPEQADDLPRAYWPAPGSDEYTDETFARVLRRDIAAYLLRVRDRSPDLADALNWALPLVPVGWCSVVAPRQTWEEFQTQARHDLHSAVVLADLLDVPYQPPLSADQSRLMRFAAAEAARRFCPQMTTARTAPVTDAQVADAARFPARDHYSIQELQREGHALPNGWFRADSATRFEVETAFQSALVGISQVPTEVGCDMVGYLLRGDAGVRETADNIWESNPSRLARLQDVWSHQQAVYPMRQERRACAAGRP